MNKIRMQHYIRKFKHPLNRVFIFSEHSDIKINVLENTEFNTNFLSETEKDKLISSLNMNKKSLFNGKSVRLDRFKTNEKGKALISISVIDFFDFLSTNLIAYPINKPSKNKIEKPEFVDVINKVKNKIKKYGKIKNGTDLLLIKELANIIAVSVLIEDIEGNVLLTERSSKAAISSGSISVSSGGSVDEEDLYNKDENPILKSAIREVSEELGFSEDQLEYKYGGLIIAKQKMQPVFIYYAKLNQKLSTAVKEIMKASDFHKENKNIYIVPKEKVALFITHSNMSDAASYQLYLYLKQKNLMKYKYNWYLTFIKTINKKNYLVKEKSQH